MSEIIDFSKFPLKSGIKFEERYEYEALKSSMESHIEINKTIEGFTPELDAMCYVLKHPNLTFIHPYVITANVILQKYFPGYAFAVDRDERIFWPNDHVFKGEYGYSPNDFEQEGECYKVKVVKI